MLRVPAIGSSVVIWECRFQAFERHVCRAHDSLTHVIKAMNHMPVMVFWQRRIGFKTGVCLNNCKKAMQLMRH